jgi:hypothetical protein
MNCNNRNRRRWSDRHSNSGRMNAAAAATTSASVAAVAMMVAATVVLHDVAVVVVVVVGFSGAAAPPMPFKWPVVGTLPDFLARGGVDRLREIYEASPKMVPGGVEKKTTAAGEHDVCLVPTHDRIVIPRVWKQWQRVGDRPPLPKGPAL